jgi:hypothetical protein
MGEEMNDVRDFPNASPSGEIRHGVRQLARDVVTLVELQAELLEVDVRDWLRKSVVPMLIFGAAAAVMGLASIPVLLLAFANWLAAATELSTAAAMLIAAASGLAVAAVCGAIAWARMKKGGRTFTRFRIELARNIRWLKHVLSRPASTAE